MDFQCQRNYVETDPLRDEHPEHMRYKLGFCALDYICRNLADAVSVAYLPGSSVFPPETINTDRNSTNKIRWCGLWNDIFSHFFSAPDFRPYENNLFYNSLF